MLHIQPNVYNAYMACGIMSLHDAMLYCIGDYMLHDIGLLT